MGEEDAVVELAVRGGYGGFYDPKPRIDSGTLNRVRIEQLDTEPLEDLHQGDRQDVLEVSLGLEPEEGCSLVLPEDVLSTVGHVRTDGDEERGRGRVDGHDLGGSQVDN